MLYTDALVCKWLLHFLVIDVKLIKLDVKKHCYKELSETHLLCKCDKYSLQDTVTKMWLARLDVKMFWYFNGNIAKN